MRTVFTLAILSIAFSFFSNSASAQSLIEVTVSSNQFSPASIEINAGDTVRWTNVGGNHNVNGSQDDFPSNPESFGNSVGSGWVYEFVFTIAGSYDYQCDPHAGFGMVGDVTVNTTTDVIETEEHEMFSIYPVPATDQVFVNVSEEMLKAGAAQVAIFNLAGEKIYETRVMTASNEAIQVSDWTPSVYLVQVTGADGSRETGRLMVR